jgi:hypothetical protein
MISKIIKFIRAASGTIIFWIIIFFLIRLTGITNPPLETEHNWRQCLTNMIARNFLEASPNILYPQIDWSGNKTGIIGAEFPLFNYIIFLVAKIFSYQHWYGRLINLIISSIGIYFFALLVEKLCDRRVAFAAGIILLSSIWFSYSRKIMPDTFSISLMLIGLYFCYIYLEKGSIITLLLFILFGSLGSLAKIPTISYLSLLAIPLLSRRFSYNKKRGLILAGMIIFSVTALWYFYWIPYLIQKYHNQLFWPKSLVQGFKELIHYWPGTLEKFYFASLHSYVALVCFLASIYLVIRNKHKLLAYLLGIFSIAFLLFMMKSGLTFSHHSYYIIPYTPLMALTGGYAISRLPARFQYILLLAISLEGILNQQHDFFIKKTELYKLELEKIANAVSHEDDLIIINGGANPQELYFAHRKGWMVNNEFLEDNSKLIDLKDKGAKYIFINRKSYQNTLAYPLIFQNDYFYIYKLTDP